MQRRKHSVEYKQQVIQEVMETGNAAAVARKHDLSPSMVSRWVRESKKGSPMKEMTSQGLKSNKTLEQEVKEAKEAIKQNQELKKIIGLRCEARNAVQTLQRALLKRDLYTAAQKPVIRSDNGPQFISNIFQEKCMELGIEHERIPCKTPNKNAHIEAFHKVVEEECLGINEFETYAQAYEAMVDFMQRYNQRRIHSSFGYLTPDEYYKACKSGSSKKLVVKL